MPAPNPEAANALAREIVRSLWRSTGGTLTQTQIAKIGGFDQSRVSALAAADSRAGVRTEALLALARAVGRLPEAVRILGNVPYSEVEEADAEVPRELLAVLIAHPERRAANAAAKVLAQDGARFTEQQWNALIESVHQVCSVHTQYSDLSRGTVTDRSDPEPRPVSKDTRSVADRTRPRTRPHKSSFPRLKISSDRPRDR